MILAYIMRKLDKSKRELVLKEKNSTDRSVLSSLRKIQYHHFCCTLNCFVPSNGKIGGGCIFLHRLSGVFIS